MEALVRNGGNYCYCFRLCAAASDSAAPDTTIAAIVATIADYCSQNLISERVVETAVAAGDPSAAAATLARDGPFGRASSARRSPLVTWCFELSRTVTVAVEALWTAAC